MAASSSFKGNDGNKGDKGQSEGVGGRGQKRKRGQVPVLLGNGNFGKVYSSGPNRAIKIIPFRSDAFLETALGYLIRHPNLMPIEAVTIRQKRRRNGAPRRRVVEMHMPRGVPLYPRWTHLTWSQVQTNLWQLLYVIHSLHLQGLCHLDIKPENLLLSKTNQLILCDFGLTLPKKILDPGTRGTPGYLKIPSKGNIVPVQADLEALLVTTVELVKVWIAGQGAKHLYECATHDIVDVTFPIDIMVPWRHMVKGQEVVPKEALVAVSQMDLFLHRYKNGKCSVSWYKVEELFRSVLDPSIGSESFKRSVTLLQIASPLMKLLGQIEKEEVQWTEKQFSVALAQQVCANHCPEDLCEWARSVVPKEKIRKVQVSTSTSSSSSATSSSPMSSSSSSSSSSSPRSTSLSSSSKTLSQTSAEMSSVSTLALPTSSPSERASSEKSAIVVAAPRIISSSASGSKLASASASLPSTSTGVSSLLSSSSTVVSSLLSATSSSPTASPTASSSLSSSIAAASSLLSAPSSSTASSSTSTSPRASSSALLSVASSSPLPFEIAPAVAFTAFTAAPTPLVSSASCSLST